MNAVATLTRATWAECAAMHSQRARLLLGGVTDRRRRGAKHPVEDFLFDYYTLRPGQLIAWHPGAGVRLADAPEYATQRWYRERDGAAEFDAETFAERRSSTIAQAAELLGAVGAKRPTFGCFGMHEWAMVYRLTPDETRHSYLPLRYSPDEIARILEDIGARCTHYDAFRFFTPDAVPLNSCVPTRDRQAELDQPGCLHANMDLYKWAGKLSPAISSELLLDCFVLARDIREIDMRASAYDVSGWGYPAIPVETAAGRAEYVRLQRDFADRAAPLRQRLLTVAQALITRSG